MLSLCRTTPRQSGDLRWDELHERLFVFPYACILLTLRQRICSLADILAFRLFPNIGALRRASKVGRLTFSLFATRRGTIHRALFAAARVPGAQVALFYLGFCRAPHLRFLKVGKKVS